MRFGVAIFPTDYAISLTELAPAAEQLGFESLWVAEHSHIPTSRQSPWAGGPELPKQYWHTMDPFVALTAAALASKSIRVATGICLVIERDPIHTAKEVASLDHISNGRFIFGIGGGWNREEMADHGTDFPTRWRLLRERVEAMKAIWTQGPKILERVVRYADGWMPNRGDVIERIPELQRMAKDAGRGPIPVTYYPKASPEEIERLARAGVERCIWYVPSDGRDAALKKLDELGTLISPYVRIGVRD